MSDLSSSGTDEQANTSASTTGLDRDAEIIVYCGSGVSACPNVVALTQIGYENVKLYPGSWSDWVSYEEHPIATGEE